MKKIGLGIIGLGYIGKVHLRHSLKLANANLVAVSDISKRALRNARESGVKKTYSDYEQLLKDPEIDAVIIALPTHLHLQCAKKAAEEKKHIFLEKPIARNVEEAEEIVSAAKRNSAKLMIGYPLRFNPTFRNVKDKIRSGTLGDVEIAHAVNIGSGPFFHREQDYAPTPVPEWWFNKELTGGGVLIDLGSHMVNLLRWYFGEITDIKSHLGYRFNFDFEDSATCLARFESGTLGVISLGWFSHVTSVQVELFGTVQHANTQHRAPNPLLTAFQMLTMGRSEFFASHLAELQHFVNCITQDSSLSSSGEDGLKDLEAISSAYRNQIQLAEKPSDV
ncbi:Gfo/Idh/MocA family oxidoreductase [Candidatus Bathyarchaeota archaeon]|nr:Gfo/Idh/MocA family oxidoreductase [Candidatus Bathyarchaeota archaeon]